MTTPVRPAGSQQQPSPALKADIDLVAIPRPANELDGSGPPDLPKSKSKKSKS